MYTKYLMHYGLIPIEVIPMPCYVLTPLSFVFRRGLLGHRGEILFFIFNL